MHGLEVDHGNLELKAQHRDERVTGDEAVQHERLDQADAGLLSGILGSLQLIGSDESRFDKIPTYAIIE